MYSSSFSAPDKLFIACSRSTSLFYSFSWNFHQQRQWWQTYIFKYVIIFQKILLGVPIVMKCLLVFKYSSQVLYRFCSTQLLFLFLRWYGSQTHKEKFGYRKLKTHKKKITTRQTFLLLSLFKTVCLLQLSIIYWTTTSTSAPSLTMFFCQ